MTDLQHYLNLWDLCNLQKLALTKSGGIYSVEYRNNPAILKVMNPQSDEQQSPGILNYYAGNGAVRLMQQQDNVLLLERLEPEPILRKMVAEGKDDEATRIIAGVVRKLHAPQTKPFPPGIKNLERHFQSLFQKAKQDAEPSSPYVKAARIARELLAEEKDVRVLHGDIHHENILHSPRGWLAIDPKGVIGERTYEVANSLCNPGGLPDIVHNPQRIQRQAAIFAEQLAMNTKRILAFAFVHSRLSICWSIEDGEAIDEGLEFSREMEKLI